MEDAAAQKIEDQQREQKDLNRLQLLPPLASMMIKEDHLRAFNQWFLQTPECNEFLQILRSSTVPGSITEDLRPRVMELLWRGITTYLKQKWSSDGKQLPQPASYFLFHKRFSRFEDLFIRLPIPLMDIVQSLVFNQRELGQIYAQGLPIIVTAVGSRELHFHEVGRLAKVACQNSWVISTGRNYDYMHSAIAEFKELNVTEVWFMRAKNGMPQFIFCPPVYAKLPVLSLPLREPGQPKAVLELSRLEAMPALLPERFRSEFQYDFYQWLLATNKFHMGDEDPENLELKSLLLRWRSIGFHISDFKIPLATRLYEEYVRDRWSTPHKQPAIPLSFYLFESGVQCTEESWIWLPQGLMQQANSLILNTTELNRLATAKALPVTISIGVDQLKDHRKQGMLENVGTKYRISFSDESYRRAFHELRGKAKFEAWFLRIEDMPNFIITPRPISSK